MPSAATRSVLAISGGVGGAKLVLGLYRCLAPRHLNVVINTADDFDHLGLRVCPDIDTVMYALAGIDNPDTGWGRRDETWSFMRAMEELGGETWFRLGDADLATSVERTRRLDAGEALSDITDAFCRRLRLGARLIPMSDDAVRTLVQTAEGEIAFQRYFVERACAPRVSGFRFAGAASARPSRVFADLLDDEALSAVVICPSNPFISIDPVLSVPGVRRRLAGCRAPVVGVSPVIAGQSLKGPTSKMMRELGMVVSAATVAARYADLLDGFVVDRRDTGLVEALHMPVLCTHTTMRSLADRERLAREVLAFATTLRRA